MDRSTAEQVMIEQCGTNDVKTSGVAYILWLFLGWLGAHRFY
ncbi:MAG: TM2 domain-containing protein, partial [Pararhizobium sp.]